MPMKPTCLHIPTLYEGAAATISWESVDNANGYELDCVFDETFEQASEGRSWIALDAAGKTWPQVEAEDLTWHAFEALAAQGLAWQTIESDDLTWAAWEQQDLTWDLFVQLPARFTVYRGLGEPVFGPDQGLNWLQFESQYTSWTDFESRNMTWQQFELQVAPGIMGCSWSSQDAQWLNWPEFEGKYASWQAFENQAADSKIHAAVGTFVPLYKKKASYRVRAYEGTSYSPYLTTGVIPIIPIFVREGTASFAVISGQKYSLQINARGIASFNSIIITMEYDTSQLALEPLQEHVSYGIVNNLQPTVYSEVSQNDGQLKFQCVRSISFGNEWAGFVAELQFKAVKTGTATIRLY